MSMDIRPEDSISKVDSRAGSINSRRSRTSSRSSIRSSASAKARAAARKATLEAEAAALERLYGDTRGRITPSTTEKTIRTSNFL